MHAREEPEHERSGAPARRPESDTESLSPSALLGLQRSAGNAAVSRLVEEGRTGPAAHDVLRSPGRPLDQPVRSEMEARLGADFSDVRLHTDGAARRSAEELGARAYTSGSHVVLGSGGADQHTLAHELTHVIQQRRGPVSGVDRGDGLSVSDPADAFEQAAEANARRAMTGPTPAAAPEPETHQPGDTRAVQRMPLAEFTQHVSTTAVAGDPDFLTYFQIRRGREDPAAVVEHTGQERLRRLVETDGVTTDLVDQYVTDYQRGAPGTPTQSTILTNPNVTGLEVELGEVVLNVPSGAGIRNGVLLATTPTTPQQDPTRGPTEAGPPVMKLEVEGMDRLNPRGARRLRANVEIIYGPLPATDYADAALISARRTLRASLQASATGQRSLTDLINNYNSRLRGAELRFELTPTPEAGQLTKGATPQTNPNTQTNVSTPYDKLGTPAPGQRDFGGFFEDRQDQQMFARARTEATRLTGLVNTSWAERDTGDGLTAGASTTALLTHVLFQEAKYLRHSTVDRAVEKPGDKHHFHVMIKASPQDAMMSVIPDDDAKLLLGWLSGNRAQPLATAARDTFRATGTSNRSAAVDPGTVYAYLVEALVARLVAGRQLLEVTGRESRVFGEAREVGSVGHFHPRPSNRRPITVNGHRYYIVVEQRSSAHALNKNTDTDAAAHARRIGDLQRP